MRQKKLIAVLAVTFGALFLPYLAFFNHVEPYEVGIAWNRVTGELWLQGAGIHFTSPWVAVSRVDTRPVRVCVNTSGRGYNCKLVQFIPEAYKELVAVEGHRYYWWANRFSFNSGYDEEYRGMKDLLRGHAYGTTRYSFIKVLEEYREPASP